MKFRVVVGIGILFAVLVILPVLALPDVRMFSPATPTGNAWVTLKNINGTGTPENVSVSYAMGMVNEIPAYAVFENQTTGLMTVTIMDASQATEARNVTLFPACAQGSVYAINTVTVSGESEPLLVNSMSFDVMPTRANYYTDVVPLGKQHEWIDLDWKDPKKDLSLMVYAPDATLGPYTDMADGRKDGRIFLDVSSALNVTPGHWFFKVRNDRQDNTGYTLNTYSA
ncbi:MAG: hypothetical protein Q7T80_03565 [Methanoregula sp.]|nr:hypothetical protein [Methanoregula sp.]